MIHLVRLVDSAVLFGKYLENFVGDGGRVGNYSQW